MEQHPCPLVFQLGRRVTTTSGAGHDDHLSSERHEQDFLTAGSSKCPHMIRSELQSWDLVSWPWWLWDLPFTDRQALSAQFDKSA